MYGFGQGMRCIVAQQSLYTWVTEGVRSSTLVDSEGIELSIYITSSIVKASVSKVRSMIIATHAPLR